MMTSAIGWYGPLIDLSNASSHVGDFVQLLVFVHRTTPVQYKLPKGGEVIRTDIQVGDETLPFFSVSLWQKQLRSVVVAGDIILLENVKITKFGHVVEAKTVQCSSIQCLIHPYELLVSKGVDELVMDCRIGKTAFGKLKNVVKWVKLIGSVLYKDVRSFNFTKMQCTINWKLPEQSKSQNLFSLSELSCLSHSCKAMFNAFIGEIFLPITWKPLGDADKENMFLSQRLTTVKDNNAAEDFICVGCQLCGSPLELEDGHMFNPYTIPLYCPKSTNHLHVVTYIYRPFLLYVWDESECLSLLVRNQAAELLFGNIKADRVYSCYRKQRHEQNPDRTSDDANKFVDKEASCSFSSIPLHSVRLEKQDCHEQVNFCLIWLLILKMMLQQGKNSPLKFEAIVNTTVDCENERYELVSVSFPCNITDQAGR